MPTPSAQAAPDEFRVLGVDQSLTCTGFSYRRDGNVYTDTIRPEPLRGIPRLYYVQQRLQEVIEAAEPHLVVFEDYVKSFGKNTGRLAHLGEIGGVLKLHVWSQGIDHMVVNPKSLKLAVTGKGGADKKAIMRAVRNRYGYVVLQEDEADAFALMVVGEIRCGHLAYVGADEGLTCIHNAEFVKGKTSLVR